MMTHEQEEEILFEGWTDQDQSCCLFRLMICVAFATINFITAVTIDGPGLYLSLAGGLVMIALACRDAYIIRHGLFEFAPMSKRHVLEGLILPAQAGLLLIICVTSSPMMPFAYAGLAAGCFATMFFFNVV